MTTPKCCYCPRPFAPGEIRQWIGLRTEAAQRAGLPSSVAHQECYQRRKRVKRTFRAVQMMMEAANER